jgi:nucleobase:cation symporter-1, NCS1 family
MTDQGHPMPQAIGTDQKLFSFWDNTAIWFSLGVGLLVVQLGSFMVGGIGTKYAFVAIIVGSLIGAAILAYGAKIGQVTGQSSASLMTATFGNGFAKLPIILNIVQLLGWTAFELVIMSDGSIAIAEKALGHSLDGIVARLVCAAFWGGILCLLLSQKMQSLARGISAKILMPLVVISLVWLSYQFISKLDATGLVLFLNAQGDGKMSLLSAMDLVIAMPISWLPLVADYARFGKSARATQSGTWLGYAIANIWCYSLGFLIASTGNVDGGMVAVILLAQGGLIALGIILIDELDNAYGDAYSSTVSIGSLVGEPGKSVGAIAFVVVCALGAAFLPMHSLEKFLIILSSVFLPLYGVIFAVFAAGRMGSASTRVIEPVYAGIWVVGIGLFYAFQTFTPNLGASLPTLALVFGATFLVARQRLSVTSVA